jgi:very-short-patch-repair endonuclease
MEGENLPTCYKLDLAWPDLKLGVEVDGASHLMKSRKLQDAKKGKALHSLGWTVLRFSNQEVMTSLETVASTVESYMR